MVLLCFALRPRVFHWDPVFSTRPRVFHQTPCFPHPVFSTRPRVFHTPGPRTPGPRPRVFHLAVFARVIFHAVDEDVISIHWLKGSSNSEMYSCWDSERNSFSVDCVVNFTVTKLCKNRNTLRRTGAKWFILDLLFYNFKQKPIILDVLSQWKMVNVMNLSRL